MNKHAYLIMAHDNFKVLKLLIESLDDARHDIYLHVDKKVKQIPDFFVSCAKLLVVKDRIDVRWGDISQVSCQILLLQKALESKESYARYHMISGTHFPLKSTGEIYDFFQRSPAHEIISIMGKDAQEMRFKLGFYHFFVAGLSHPKKYIQRISNWAWRAVLKIQKVIKFSRSMDFVPLKASSWMSLTPDAASYVVENKKVLLKRFRYTFCADEYFIPYLLLDNHKFRILDEPNLLYTDFMNAASPRNLTMSDYEMLTHSEFIFARKFTDQHIDVIVKLKEANNQGGRVIAKK